MAEPEAKARGLDPCNRLGEKAKLFAGVALVFLARLVGDGKMGKDALGVKAGEPAGARKLGCAPLKLRARAEEAETGHAGVRRHMDPQGAAEALCRGGEGLGLLEARDGLGDVVSDQQRRVPGIGVAQDQDRHGDAALSELQRLVKAGHREIVRARLFQQTRRLQRAVAVGVGLHHAQKAAALGQR